MYLNLDLLILVAAESFQGFQIIAVDNHYASRRPVCLPILPCRVLIAQMSKFQRLPR